MRAAAHLWRDHLIGHWASNTAPVSGTGIVVLKRRVSVSAVEQTHAAAQARLVWLRLRTFESHVWRAQVRVLRAVRESSEHSASANKRIACLPMRCLQQHRVFLHVVACQPRLVDLLHHQVESVEGACVPGPCEGGYNSDARQRRRMNAPHRFETSGRTASAG